MHLDMLVPQLITQCRINAARKI